jgi:3-oxoacyl-[acyl-carrier-protein] synthase III
MSIKIVGIGSYLPNSVLTNNEIAKNVLHLMNGLKVHWVYQNEELVKKLN